MSRLKPVEKLAALTKAARKIREKRERKKADLRDAATHQYGVRGGLRVDTDVIEELCGGSKSAKTFFPEAIVKTLESGADPDDYATFSAAFKENIEAAEVRAIIEGGIEK